MRQCWLAHPPPSCVWCISLTDLDNGEDLLLTLDFSHTARIVFNRVDTLGFFRLGAAKIKKKKKKKKKKKAPIGFFP